MSSCCNIFNAKAWEIGSIRESFNKEELFLALTFVNIEKIVFFETSGVAPSVRLAFRIGYPFF